MKENARVNFEAAATTAMKYNVLLDRNASYPVVFYLSRRGWGISNELVLWRRFQGGLSLCKGEINFTQVLVGAWEHERTANPKQKPSHPRYGISSDSHLASFLLAFSSHGGSTSSQFCSKFKTNSFVECDSNVNNESNNEPQETWVCIILLTSLALKEILDLLAVVDVIWIARCEEVELGIALLLLANLVSELKAYQVQGSSVKNKELDF